jgi:hypothetical protein
VNSGQVWSLVRIAVVADESEISAVVCSAMLASDDVLDVTLACRRPGFWAILS